MMDVAYVFIFGRSRLRSSVEVVHHRALAVYGGPFQISSI